MADEPTLVLHHAPFAIAIDSLRQMQIEKRKAEYNADEDPDPSTRTLMDQLSRKSLAFLARLKHGEYELPSTARGVVAVRGIVRNLV